MANCATRQPPAGKHMPKVTHARRFPGNADAKIGCSAKRPYLQPARAIGHQMPPAAVLRTGQRQVQLVHYAGQFLKETPPAARRAYNASIPVTRKAKWLMPV